MKLPISKLTKSQSKKLGPRVYDNGNTRLTVEIRYDDNCGNGHNSFAITGNGHERIDGRWVDSFFGCCHDEIIKVYPELEKYIKWHLTSSDGPMHYLANVTYFASDRDYNGRLKGEPFDYELRLRFDEVPLTHGGRYNQKFLLWLKELKSFKDLQVVAIEHVKDSSYDFKPKYTFKGYNDEIRWHQCPFDTELEALEFLMALQGCKVTWDEIPTQWGKGKEREFKNARDAALWPEATEEQLSLPKDELTKLLNARLPALMEEFKKDMEELGFTY